MDELRLLIATDGPITVARYMSLALGHPTLGYYTTRDPLGRAGDFTTAPEISQMFGELIGVWAAETWLALGAPKPVHLIELGPGRGTLMADALRASRAVPAFRAALDVHLVETSPVLQNRQRATLAGFGGALTWHTDVDTLPDGPALVIANEFFDALPIRQFQRVERGWCERLVGLDEVGQLRWGLAGEAEASLNIEAPAHAILEVAAAARDVFGTLCRRLSTQGGALLVIDYGSAQSGVGDTLQAVKAHCFVDPLDDPGEADLTAHVDFAALARLASDLGLQSYGPVTQRHFLRGLGISERAAALMRRATPEQAAGIESAVMRLIGPDPGMGDLFKVLAVTARTTPAPPGFASET